MFRHILNGRHFPIERLAQYSALLNNTAIMIKPIGYRWRSSTWFVLTTIAIAVFAGLFAAAHMLKKQLAKTV